MSLSAVIYVVDACMKALAEVMNNVYHTSITLSYSSLVLCSLSLAVIECSRLFTVITSAKNCLIYFQGTVLCTGFKNNNGRDNVKVSRNHKKILDITIKQARRENLHACL